MSFPGQPRPPTPQILVHRQPDKAEFDPTKRPSKYIILIMGSTAVAGKVQISQTVARGLSCPLLQGDSLHESTAKAAIVGAARNATAENAEATHEGATSSAPNETRYQRMWLSRMTRTGHLFPEESRPAAEGFSGFGGSSMIPTSKDDRRGSSSSVASVASTTPGTPLTPWSSEGQSTPPASSSHPPRPTPTTFPKEATTHNPVFTLSELERLRRANPALLVLAHPQLEPWHKLAIRNATREYGIGIIFVPLYEEQDTDSGDDDNGDDLPILRPLDPRTMISFPTSFGEKRTRVPACLDKEMKVIINTNADVEGKIKEILDSCREIMGVAPTPLS